MIYKCFEKENYRLDMKVEGLKKSYILLRKL